MCCLQSDMGPSLWQKHQDRNRAWLFSQSSNWTSPRKRTHVICRRSCWGGDDGGRGDCSVVSPTRKTWTVSYKLKSCFCLLLDQINVHDYCLNTALGSRGGPRCRPSVIRGHVASQWSCVPCRLDVQPERWSHPTVSVFLRHLQKAVSLPSDPISGQNKEFQHFCQRSERLISLWVSVDRRQQCCASDLLMWTGNRLPQSNNTKERAIKQTWQLCASCDCGRGLG